MTSREHEDLMDMEIVLRQGDRVDALYDGRAIVTDQDGSAAAPFELFLASIGTCAGIYVSRFCRQRRLSVGEIRIRLRAVENPETLMVERVELVIELPRDFPDRYREPVVRAAQLCTVKKHLARPPVIEVSTSIPVAA